MRMDPTDIADVTGVTYTYLLNGKSATQNWTTLFKPDERIRMRFINAGAMTHFDIRIPGLDMTLVQACSQTVAVLDFGRLLASGPTDEVLHDPRVLEAYLGMEEPVA